MDPKGAMEWSMEHSEGSDRDRRIGQSFATWVQQDTEGAENWLQSQPEELKTDSLYSRASRQ